MKTTAQRLTLAAALAVAGIGGVAAAQAAEVNLYSERQEFLVAPLLEAFENETGIKVNAVYLKKGMLERLKAEGERSAADVILTTDIGNLHDHVEAGVLQPVESEILETNIPAQYRHPDGLWYGLTVRARVIYAHKDRVKPGEVNTYADLAKPHMKGRVCTRSGKHLYNISLLAGIIVDEGVEGAEKWAAGLKDNLARKPQGNDRAQVKAIYQGECDVSLGNTYYMGKMATNEKEPEQKQWAEAVRIVFPNQGAGGTHVNISGGAVTKAAKNKESALRLLEFLSGDDAQRIYAERNFEYPVKPGVDLHPLVASWGTFEADATPLAEIAEQRAEASRVMDRVAFDH